MRVASARNGAIIISVGATSGMLVMSTATVETRRERARPFDDRLRRATRDRRAELLAQREETVVALARARAEIAERDAPAMQRGERREIRRRGRVAFDVDVAGPIRLRPRRASVW